MKSGYVAGVKRFVRDNLTRSRESNARIALSVGYGVSCGILPIWGFQTLFALATAFPLKLNKALVTGASCISFTPLLAAILYASYWIGCKLLRDPLTIDYVHLSLRTAGNVMTEVVLGSLILAVTAGALTAGLMYGILQLFRKPS